MPYRPPKLPKRCVICNTEFETRYDRYKTCSTKCSLERLRIMEHKKYRDPKQRARVAKWQIAHPDKVKEYAMRAKLKKREKRLEQNSVQH